MLTITSPIRTERLLLRPFTTDDLADLYAIHSRPDVVRYLYSEARSFDEVRDLLARKVGHTRLIEEGDRITLAITVQGDAGNSSVVIGEASLWWRNVEHRQGEIGYILHPDYQGHGYATEASGTMLDIGFRQMGLHRIYGRADARNGASAAVMRRLGMRQEAHFVQNEMFKGEWGDEVVFAMLEDEWRA